MQPTAEFLDQALIVARAAADAAAAVIRRYYRSGFDVEIKADETPVTVADRAAEAAIKQVLRAAYPDHAYYGEEEGREGDSDWLWLIDPIDGTKSFVRGYPFFSTQIALRWRDELVLGVSCASEYGELVWARRGGGAWLAGERLQVSAAEDFTAQTAISFGNVKTLSRDARWQALARMVQRCGRTRGYGDFLHYHLLARGCIDLVVESDLNILDIAPLVVILREAGAVVTDLDGAAPDLATTSLLAGPPALHARALAEFRTALAG
ncbi:MAG: inositol-phosphate phosphatase [Lysobacterales bacterium 69-70]|nr:inositol-phosphate phosphatase [Xanthomonadaceae bacterium]ODU35173.1 MAG: inositol-phosphate phosphatase [Xanthomonadaceae bacterium SCN 69-320]ODV16429.1 MAG: inositol-phosphate phosphatase [Xanthomonadaceae bacterium SCN 69-25]OJY94072.1 MAG: inositol-phosphate phosphatase [Xanthomonadales bacterium 69-70]